MFFGPLWPDAMPALDCGVVGGECGGSIFDPGFDGFGFEYSCWLGIEDLWLEAFSTLGN